MCRINCRIVRGGVRGTALRARDWSITPRVTFWRLALSAARLASGPARALHLASCAPPTATRPHDAPGLSRHLRIRQALVHVCAARLGLAAGTQREAVGGHRGGPAGLVVRGERWRHARERAEGSGAVVGHSALGDE